MSAGVCLDKEDAINHKADIVLGDSSLSSNGDGYFLEGVDICNLIHLHKPHIFPTKMPPEGKGRVGPRALT